MLSKWEVLDRQPALDLGLFKVWKKQARSPRTGDINEVLSLEFPAWVLVMPVTPTGEVVMIRQYRHGNEDICLELPGGLVDATDRSPEAAIRRELLEETGYPFTDETDNTACQAFLATPRSMLRPLKTVIWSSLG